MNNCSTTRTASVAGHATKRSHESINTDNHYDNGIDCDDATPPLVKRSTSGYQQKDIASLAGQQQPNDITGENEEEEEGESR